LGFHPFSNIGCKVSYKFWFSSMILVFHGFCILFVCIELFMLIMVFNVSYRRLLKFMASTTSAFESEFLRIFGFLGVQF
jgi:dolichyl-phosphate-mannose--protein O-mannosyl transferase